MLYPNIEAERARKGMSKREFSKLLGVTDKTYNSWVTGETPVPSNALIKMSKICEANIDYLLGLSSKKVG